MNFQQLRIIRETVRRGFNLTEVANALFTSQSGVSKHIKDLEDELGIELFVRKGKRLLGLTPPGEELVVMVERMLLDGEADIGVATEALAEVPELASFPYYGWQHAVVVPAGHALEQVRPLTLEAIATYPLITYHEGFTGRTRIDRTFTQAGLTPDVVMSALDADVIKTYVELGLGVGILASMAFNPARDPSLRKLDSDHLFGGNVTRIAVRRGHYLRGFAYRFIELCAPELTETVVADAVGGTAG